MDMLPAALAQRLDREKDVQAEVPLKVVYDAAVVAARYCVSGPVFGAVNSSFFSS